MRLKKIIFVFFYCSSYGTLCAQDYHYAQFDALPLNLNPALIGDRSEEEFTGLRINSGYRDQRSNFTNGSASYRSFFQSFDFLTGDRFSNGLLLSNTRSVNNVFSITNMNIGTSYKLVGTNNCFQDRHQFMVGVQFGVANNSFSPTTFTYDKQYSPNAPDGFDESLPSGENFQSSVAFKFTGNMGITYRAYLAQGKLIINTGASIYNITTSTERFNGVLLPIPLRYNGYLCATYKLEEKLTLVPQALFMYQTGAHELNLGSLLYYHLNPRNKVIMGANWRQKNAIIAQAGISVAGLTIRASYCIAIGYLSNFNNRGFEVTLTYIRRTPKSPTEE
jgi:type IX secretion system PorP/SprF family membrane protein